MLPNTADTRTRVTQSITLNIPLLSSAMDTVTEARMAISMAQSGGMGVIHRNLTIEEQAREVRRVKRFESGIVYNPITLSPDQTLADAKALQDRYNVTGFPVVDETGRVVGIVTNRDMRFAEDDRTPVRVMMTSNDLAILQEPADRDEAKSLMKARRIEKLLVTDKAGKLTGLLTLRDTEQAVLNPTACKDDLGRLRVAAASTVGDAGFERSQALIDAGVDMVVIDTAHGHSEGVARAVERIKALSNAVQVVAGNVATAEATRALIGAGADAVKVGIGPGSICTTRMVAGVGVPQLTAVMDSARAAVISPRRLRRVRLVPWWAACWRAPMKAPVRSFYIKGGRSRPIAAWEVWAQWRAVRRIAIFKRMPPVTSWCPRVSRARCPTKALREA